MNKDLLTKLLGQVASGSLTIESAREKLSHLSFEAIDCAHIDHHRSLRKGFCEVIFGQGKTCRQILDIMERLRVYEDIILVTRLDSQNAQTICNQYDCAVYHEDARVLVYEKHPPPVTGAGEIMVLSAGTSDIPVAKEAVLTAAAMGNRVHAVYDVGVAGIHRLFAHQERIQNAAVLVVVAGMEGALPSVVAGMVKAPVIAVPTSIGYGTSFGGIAALLGMLNSCSSNIAVVNIDNGFGAGYMAATINMVGC